jgi:Organic solvent tolerance protein OstA
MVNVKKRCKDPIMGLYFTLVVGLLVLGGKGWADTQVQAPSAIGRLKVETHDTLLLADAVHYDHVNQQIHAQGHVEISHNEVTLFADRVSYDQLNNKIIAAGNVWLVEQTGQVMQMDTAELSGDLKTGVATAVKGIMADESLFVANRVRRKAGQENRFEEAVYTPCELCRSNPDAFPTWQLKSRHMVWNEEQETVTHGDAHLEMFGVPVFYTPYLLHPGPNAKRKSGFLTPFFGGSGDLGFMVGVPYYWAFAEDQDLTIMPVYTKENPLLSVKYRYRFCRGHLDIETSVTQSTYKRGPIGAERKQNKLRGHIKAKGLYKINPVWRAGFDVHRALDDTYLKRYKFLGYSSESFLTSRLYSEGFWGRNYAVIQGLNYQSLRQGDKAATIPVIAPSADLHLLSTPQAWNGTYFLDANVLNLQRVKGQNVRRGIVEGGWKTQLINSWGMVSDLGLHLRGDVYSVTNLKLSDQTKYSGKRTRFIPKASYAVRYPFYTVTNSGRVVVEPTVGTVVTANNRNSLRMPNEDSALFELSHANLFNSKRIAGYDLVDQWSRVNYGVKMAYFSKLAGNSELFIGQSRSIVKVPANLSDSGLARRASDLIMLGKINYKDWLNLDSRLLLKKATFTARRHESTLKLGKPILSLNTGYTRFPKLSNRTMHTEQASYGLSSQFTEHWTISGRTIKELGRKGGTLAHAGDLIYQDECFAFTTSVTKTFYTDRDVRPALTVLFKLSFKNLGDVEISGDQLGLNREPGPEKPPELPEPKVAHP